MSEIYKVINDIVESKLLELHTAFLAKVVAVNGKKYSIKPLAKYKQYGEEAKEYPVITNVYRTKGRATGKTSSYSHSHTIPSYTTSTYEHSHTYQTIGTEYAEEGASHTHTSSTGSTSGDSHSHTISGGYSDSAGGELDVSVQFDIKVGDIVLCVALERDMSNLTNGKPNLPYTGVHHRINDAIIIDVVDM